MQLACLQDARRRQFRHRFTAESMIEKFKRTLGYSAVERRPIRIRTPM